MSKENILSLFSYVLYTNLLTPAAASLTRDMSFKPDSTIHELKLAVESKLRHKEESLNTLVMHPPPPPPPPPERAPVSQCKPAKVTAPRRDVWCYYHKTPKHASSECNFLRGQRQRNQRDFHNPGARP